MADYYKPIIFGKHEPLETVLVPEAVIRGIEHDYCHNYITRCSVVCPTCGRILYLPEDMKPYRKKNNYGIYRCGDHIFKILEFYVPK